MVKRTLIFLQLLLLTACNTDDLLSTKLSSTESASSSELQQEQMAETPGVPDSSDNTPTSPIEGEPSFSLDKVPPGFLDYVHDRLSASRYMEKNCRPFSYPGYEGLPTQYCEYSILGAARAPVVMLNPSPEQLSAWIADACDYAQRNINSCVYKLYKNIMNASGAQFPIAGVVYENLDGDSRAEAYVFRHGVTVRVSSIPGATESRLNWSHFNDALWAAPTQSYTYARIVSTTREQYYSYMKREGLTAVDVGTSSRSNRKLSWIYVVQYLYKQSWNKEANPLIRAWAYSNRHSL